MITIFQAGILMVSGMALLLIAALGGVWVGGWLHHRGVISGTGSRESLSGKVPDGAMFRVGGDADLNKEPETANAAVEGLTGVTGRVGRVLESMGLGG